MQPITPNQTTIINAKSEAINTQQVILPIDRHISDIQEHLRNNTVSKTLIERKINIFETLYPAITNNKSLKSSLKKIETLLTQFYQQKTSIDINLSSAGSSETSIEQDKESFKKLNPLVTQECIKIDNTLQQISQYINNNNINIESLCEKQDDLTEIYNSIYNIIINNNDIVVDNLLIKLYDAMEKINNSKATISLLLQKETLNLQLQSYTDNSMDQKEKTKELQKILASAENFDVFENFPSIYKQFIEQYLLSIDADSKNFDYDLELTKIKDQNAENKTIAANNLKQQEALKKITILKDKIITLAEKIENINDINS